MGILEKIAEIEKEISRTQKNKGNVNFLFVEIQIGMYIKKKSLFLLSYRVSSWFAKSKVSKI